MLVDDYDDFVITVGQNIYRPNNPNDYDLIFDYLYNNYGDKKSRAVRLMDIPHLEVVGI